MGKWLNLLLIIGVPVVYNFRDQETHQHHHDNGKSKQHRVKIGVCNKRNKRG
jgi:hypothetical protein